VHALMYRASRSIPGVSGGKAATGGVVSSNAWTFDAWVRAFGVNNLDAWS